MSKTLLIVHHTPSPATRELLEAVVAGANDPEIEGVDVLTRPALAATVPDLLDADGYLFGTPANLGYMSGALKHYLGQYSLIKRFAHDQQPIPASMSECHATTILRSRGSSTMCSSDSEAAK